MQGRRGEFNQGGGMPPSSMHQTLHQGDKLSTVNEARAEHNEGKEDQQENSKRRQKCDIVFDESRHHDERQGNRTSEQSQ